MATGPMRWLGENIPSTKLVRLSGMELLDIVPYRYDLRYK